MANEKYSFRQRIGLDLAEAMIKKYGIPLRIEDGLVLYKGEINIATYVNNLPPDKLKTPDFAYLVIEEITGDSALANLVGLACLNSTSTNKTLEEFLQLILQKNAAVREKDYEKAADCRDKMQQLLARGR